MILTRVLGLVSMLVLAVTAVAEQAVPTELHIEYTYTPENCKVKAQDGDKLLVHYVGKLWANGDIFDSSVYREVPLPVTLGVGQVIRGWEEGLQGICVGEKRVLTIPADKAYGSRGFGGVIPPDAALVFDVELIELNRPGGHQEL